MLEGIPWYFYQSGTVRFWVHYGLVCFGFLLVVITMIAQWKKPAPYGKHDINENNWGPPMNQRLGHILSDATPGVLLFLLVFFLYGGVRGFANYAFLSLWLCHYIHRGIIHPLVMRYRSRQVAVGIPLGGFIPNCLFHFINADFIGNASYSSHYYYDPRFLIGILLYILGFIINKWADCKLRSLRKTKGEHGCTGYYIPEGGLFELISCPNYFGELVEWLGWAIATWSLAGLIWALFGASTFIPRSWHNHNWYKLQFEHYPPTSFYLYYRYKLQFEHYPPTRKALIPCIY